MYHSTYVRIVIWRFVRPDNLRSRNAVCKQKCIFYAHFWMIWWRTLGYASFWSPTNTQPAFSQYAIQQCVTLVMCRFSYHQQIRHLTVHYSLFDPSANSIKLKLSCTNNTFVTTFKNFKILWKVVERLCCNVNITRSNTCVYGVQSKSVYLVSPQKIGKHK